MIIGFTLGDLFFSLKSLFFIVQAIKQQSDPKIAKIIDMVVNISINTIVYTNKEAHAIPKNRNPNVKAKDLGLSVGLHLSM